MEIYSININETLELNQFRKMDYAAIEKYNISIELMMENAGLQLARLIAQTANIDENILFGIGNGNNGGGGLVAARRLAAWGYDVYLDTPVIITKVLPLKQYDRALLVGVNNTSIKSPHIWVDAYLGFSQRFPLSDPISKSIKNSNMSNAFRISLDIPTGISKNQNNLMFLPNQVMTIAAPKRILCELSNEVELFLADIGIPKSIYTDFNTKYPPFNKSQLIKYILK